MSRALSRRQGLSGLLPSLATAVQSPGDVDRFSTGGFFGLVAALMVASGAAFYVLHTRCGYAEAAAALDAAPAPGGGGDSGADGWAEGGVALPLSPRAHDLDHPEPLCEAGPVAGRPEPSVEYHALVGVGVGASTGAVGAHSHSHSHSLTHGPGHRTRLCGGRVPARLDVRLFPTGVQVQLASLGLLSFVQNGILPSIATFVMLPFANGNKVRVGGGEVGVQEWGGAHVWGVGGARVAACGASAVLAGVTPSQWRPLIPIVRLSLSLLLLLSLLLRGLRRCCCGPGWPARRWSPCVPVCPRCRPCCWSAPRGTQL